MTGVQTCALPISSAVVRVRDTGMGIAPEDRERIFDRFYRVDKGRSREMGGTGLGLSITKELAKLLGGEIRLQSEFGKGSVFVVELPIRITTEGTVPEARTRLVSEALKSDSDLPVTDG